MNNSITYSGIGSQNQSIVATNYRLPGNPAHNIKHRGISISKSSREHKLKGGDASAVATVSAVYQSDFGNSSNNAAEDTRRTVASANTAAGNHYSGEVYYQYPANASGGGYLSNSHARLNNLMGDQ